MSSHPALVSGRVAVVTGAAGGIGLAAARRFAALGMTVCMADTSEERLLREAAAIGGAAVAVPCDVSRMDELRRLKDTAFALGPVAVLMNNAAIGEGGGPFENIDRWHRLVEVNLFGPIHGVQAFGPAMLTQNIPGVIINTGSKQGITTPPGDTAYNVTKAGVKVLTEALAHALREVSGCQVTAHLLIPGHTFTGMTARTAEKPPGAWTPEQVIDFMLDGIARGDFYILCPDNDVTRAMDEKRVRWAAEDIIRNRPALSRWHPDYTEAFKAYMAEP